ncbi:MAG: hypothetical protein ABI561_18320 [Bradyrhizobium sp.]
MSGGDDDLFSGDEGEAVSEFDRLTDLLFYHISDFADDEDIPDELLPLLLLRLSLTTRMSPSLRPVGLNSISTASAVTPKTSFAR